MLWGVWNIKRGVKNDSVFLACTTRDTEVPFTKMWETAGGTGYVKTGKRR